MNGALVLRHASRGSSREHVNVIHLLLSMVERNVMEMEKKHKFVTTKSRVQVCKSSFRIDHGKLYSIAMIKELDALFIT